MLLVNECYFSRLKVHRMLTVNTCAFILELRADANTSLDPYYILLDNTFNMFKHTEMQQMFCPINWEQSPGAEVNTADQQDWSYASEHLTVLLCSLPAHGETLLLLPTVITIVTHFLYIQTHTLLEKIFHVQPFVAIGYPIRSRFRGTRSLWPK